MAEYSVPSSSHSSSTRGHPGLSQRPNAKRVHHTWHGETSGLSHFEDFMLELGVDPKVVHLCCVPRPEMKLAHHMRKHSKSHSERKAVRSEDTLSDFQVSNHDRSRSFIKPYQTHAGNGSESKSDEPHKHVEQPHRLRRSTLLTPLALIDASNQHLKVVASFAIQSDSFSASFASISPTAARDTLLAISSNYSISRPPYLEPGPSEPTNSLAWPSDIPNLTPPLLSSEPIPSASSTSTLTTRSRTSSIASLATASSSEGPATPRAHSPLMSPSLELHRSLSDLEHSSRFRIPTRCVTCKRSGSNFPCCPKCGDMWCSRHCRMSGGKDGRHSCHCKTMEPSIVYA